jgi:hypothetical protein
MFVSTTRWRISFTGEGCSYTIHASASLRLGQATYPHLDILVDNFVDATEDGIRQAIHVWAGYELKYGYGGVMGAISRETAKYN